MGIYRTAQVCLNGHETTSSLETSPELKAAYCDVCGEVTITECPDCKTPIRGNYHVEGVFSFGSYIPPKFCFSCGKPLPWTTTKIKAAKELADELPGLKPYERKMLKAAIDDLSLDSPRKELAVHRYSKITGKLKSGTSDILKSIVVNVISEATKKLLLWD